MAADSFSQRLLSLWTALIVVGIAGALWVSVAERISTALVTSVPSPGVVLALLVTVALMVMGFVAKAGAFFGPVRASAADLVWRPAGHRQAIQRLQVGFWVGAGILVVLVLLVQVALQAGLTTGTVLGLTVAIVTGSVSIVFGESWLQTKDLTVLSTLFGDSLLVAAIVVLVATAAAVPLFPALLTATAFAAVVAAILMRRVSRPRRPRLQGIPAWELLRAHANTFSVMLAIVDVNVSHLRGANGSHKVTRRAFKTLHGNAGGLFVATLARTLGRQWLPTLVLPVLALVMGSLVAAPFAVFGALVGSIILSVKNAALWAQWSGTPGLPRLFSASIRTPSTVVFAALCIAPVSIACIGSLLAGPAAALAATVVALISTAYILVARARVARNNRKFGDTSTFVYLPEIGYIPVGVAGRAFAGWLPALVCIYLSVQFGTWAGIIPLATLLASAVNRDLRER